ncbi:MAG: DUF4340 domain-containing protein [Desulfamplus sp.]|nr:DUF4340 domain-containing protein [Desulfamplus sp.]
MKKAYIIPGLLILLLSAYLVLHDRDRSHYTLPFIPGVAVSDISEITVEKGGVSIIITGKDGVWSVTDKNYPADKNRITEMLDIIKNLKVTALVSEEGDNLARYELDPENRIKVTVKSEAEVLREFEIGKAAPSFRHTFIRIKGSRSVYHAPENFRRNFDKSVDDLRDSNVLTFEKDKITHVTLEKGGKMEIFDLSKGGGDAQTSDLPQGQGDDQTSDTSKGEGYFQTSDTSGEEPDISPEKPDIPQDKRDALDSMLSTLSSLKCSRFADIDSKDEAFQDMETAASITMKGDKTLSLKIFSKDGELFPAISSENDYPFYLDTWQGENLLKKMDEIMDIDDQGDTQNRGSMMNSMESTEVLENMEHNEDIESPEKIDSVE